MPKKIKLTGGNIRNGHIYLRSCEALIPPGGIGGANKSDPGLPFTVRFEGGERCETDVAGDKMILRARAPVKNFFERTAAQEGDEVIVERTGEREIVVRLVRA